MEIDKQRELMKRMKEWDGEKVLVYVDGSKESDAAFDYAMREKNWNDHLTLLNFRRKVDDDCDFDKAENVPRPFSILNKYAEKCRDNERNCQFKLAKYGEEEDIGMDLCTEISQADANELIIGMSSRRKDLEAASNYLIQHCEHTYNLVLVKSKQPDAQSLPEGFEKPPITELKL